jgi:hypothetical protein
VVGGDRPTLGGARVLRVAAGRWPWGGRADTFDRGSLAHGVDAAAGTIAVAGAAYLAALLAVDHFATRHGQWALGALTWLALLGMMRLFPVERRAQALGVVLFATVGELTGSIIWGVYTYRLENLPLFVPPAHGLVYLTGFALALGLRKHGRTLVAAAATAAVTWGLLGLTLLPRRDVAGAFGLPLLLVFLWRSQNRQILAAVFFVVGALEFYGTALGTWRWAAELPGLGIPDGNPPSGVASGYVWFDVMALLVAPAFLRLASPRRNEAPARRLRGADGVADDRHALAAGATLVEVTERERDEVATLGTALAIPHHPLERAAVPDEARQRVVARDRSHDVL